MKRKKWSGICLTALSAAALIGGCAKAPAAQTEAAVQAEMAVQTEAAVQTETADQTETTAAEAQAADAQTADAQTDTDSEGSSLAFTEIEDGAVPLYAKPEAGAIRVPQTGGITYGNGRATIDASNIDQGYVMVKYTGSQGKIKVQVTKGGTTYTYDLNARDSYEVFPFSEGNGTYSVKVFENVSGNQYAQVYSKDLSVNLSDQFAPFLYPNQYVNFSAGSAAVQTAAQLAAPAADAIGVVTNVYNYVVGNITYDTAKAASVQSGYLPNVDNVLATRTGICFDYAALMTAMLRSQNIPTKLVVGYTGNLYHAWINVYIDSVGWVDNFIYFDGQDWSLMDPTFAASGGQNESIKQYIGNGANYQAKYSY